MLALKWRLELNSEHSLAGQSPALKVVSSAREDAMADDEHSGGKSAEAIMLESLSPEERSQEILSIILTELDDNKAEEITKIDLAGKSDIADAMVIASGRSQRHVGAVAEKVQRRLKEAGLGHVKVEGMPACDWVLIDAGDVVVHLFRPEVRDFYKLERIWSETAYAPKKADESTAREPSTSDNA